MTGYEPVGRGFESLQPYQKSTNFPEEFVDFTILKGKFIMKTILRGTTTAVALVLLLAACTGQPAPDGTSSVSENTVISASPSYPNDAPGSDRPTLPEDVPAGVEHLYDFQFSDRYDARVSSDFSLIFPSTISTGLKNSELSLLERYQNELVPDGEKVYDGDGMVPHSYKDYYYSFDETGWLLVKTDFYEPDDLEYICYVCTNLADTETSLGVGVGSSEQELLSAYTDDLYYLGSGQEEPVYVSLDEAPGLEFDCAYVWQPFTTETNEIRDITFYLCNGTVSAVEMTEPFELRYVYGCDRDSGLQLANERRAELLSEKEPSPAVP